MPRGSGERRKAAGRNLGEPSVVQRLCPTLTLKPDSYPNQVGLRPLGDTSVSQRLGFVTLLGAASLVGIATWMRRGSIIGATAGFDRIGDDGFGDGGDLEEFGCGTAAPSAGTFFFWR